MTITITSIKLKSIWKFFKLSLFALQNTKQLQKSKGMLKFKKTGLGRLHYTITVWETEDDLKAYAYGNGSHKEFMSRSKEIASEIGTYTFESSEIPDWKTAKNLLSSKGRFLKFDH
jgi:hypothetical protein